MISHQHRVVFVHVPKTAGQSIELAFLRHLGLTWDDRETLLLRRNGDPDRGPQRLAHMYAAEYVALGYLSAEDFASYTKFAVVRDPLDKFKSEYRYRSPRGTRSVRDFYDNRPDDEYSNAARHMAPQHRYLYDGDKLLVDHVVRYETLAQEWPALSQRLFGEDVPLPHANAGGRPSGDVVVDADLRAAIADRYRRDFELFGYPSRA